MTSLCANCGVSIEPSDAIEIQLKHQRTTVTVCSPECRGEWFMGYAAEVKEQLEGLEVSDG